MWHIWGERDAYKLLVGKTEGNSEEDLGEDGMILKWIFSK
jgi:hypothetical protein